MSIEVTKRDREPTGSLLRRFVRRVQQSRVLLDARTKRFYLKDKTRRQTKESALRREELKKLREKLFKAGQVNEGELIPKEKIRKLLNK
ncbi:30S ribosomal protein S21 [Candidatus Falkowbacteria bacterium]|nr:30S ribosomal protein S21 [Candidatus Falkowbacteria bacterium]